MASATVQFVEPRENVTPGYDPGLDVHCDGQNDGRAVSLEQYLHNIYNPDCDYINGHLQERNLGEYDHARLQANILSLFSNRAAEWQVRALPELRLQVSPANYRITDIMVLHSNHKVDR